MPSKNKSSKPLVYHHVKSPTGFAMFITIQTMNVEEIANLSTP